MPQFDPSTFASQIFWLVVTFAALYWVVAKLAVPRVGQVLEQRARVIQDDLDRAMQLKGETDAALAAYESAMSAARGQAGDHMRAMLADVKAVADKRTEEISASVAKQVAEAEARIGKAKQDALASMKTLAGESAAAIVAKLTGLDPDGGAVATAVAAALKDTRS